MHYLYCSSVLLSTANLREALNWFFEEKARTVCGTCSCITHYKNATEFRMLVRVWYEYYDIVYCRNSNPSPPCRSKVGMQQPPTSLCRRSLLLTALPSRRPTLPIPSSPPISENTFSSVSVGPSLRKHAGTQREVAPQCHLAAEPQGYV